MLGASEAAKVVTTVVVNQLVKNSDKFYICCLYQSDAYAFYWTIIFESPQTTFQVIEENECD